MTLYNNYLKSIWILNKNSISKYSAYNNINIILYQNYLLKFLDFNPIERYIITYSHFIKYILQFFTKSKQNKNKIISYQIKIEHIINIYQNLFKLLNILPNFGILNNIIIILWARSKKLSKKTFNHFCFI
jgi:hypothetical protein